MSYASNLATVNLVNRALTMGNSWCWGEVWVGKSVAIVTERYQENSSLIIKVGMKKAKRKGHNLV